MKLIIAYIKEHKLSEVALALHEIEGLTGLTVSDVRGFGRMRPPDDPERDIEETMNFLSQIKLELFCRDELVDEIISTIKLNASTGLRGDGKIYTLDVLNAIRINTGEKGEDVV